MLIGILGQRLPPQPLQPVAQPQPRSVPVLLAVQPVFRQAALPSPLVRLLVHLLLHSLQVRVFLPVLPRRAPAQANPLLLAQLPSQQASVPLQPARVPVRVSVRVLLLRVRPRLFLLRAQVAQLQFQPHLIPNQLQQVYLHLQHHNLLQLLNRLVLLARVSRHQQANLRLPVLLLLVPLLHLLPLLQQQPSPGTTPIRLRLMLGQSVRA